MAIVDATESLCRCFTSLLRVHSRLNSARTISSDVNAIFGLGSPCTSTSRAAATTAERESTEARNARGHSICMPLGVSSRLRLLHRFTAISPLSASSSSLQSVALSSTVSSTGSPTDPLGVFSRGMASKARMKYAKKKKAPVDRFGSLDPAQPRLGFERVEALEKADETVKKLFSLEFGSGNDLHKMRRKMSEELMWDKPDEKKDLAVKIATITEHIKAVAAHVENNKKDSVNKVRLLNAIDRRRKMLKYLRRQDHGRFQQVLAQLNLTWTQPPAYYRRTTRRAAEKAAVVREAHAQRRRALWDFERAWRAERLVEIARLKVELGRELTAEERLALETSGEQS